MKWSNGQRTSFLFWRSEFKSRFSLQFLLCVNVQEKNENHWKTRQDWPFWKNYMKTVHNSMILKGELAIMSITNSSWVDSSYLLVVLKLRVCKDDYFWEWRILLVHFLTRWIIFCKIRLMPFYMYPLWILRMYWALENV